MKRKQPVHRVFEEKFGDALYSKATNYVVSIQDLVDISEILIDHVFKGGITKSMLHFLVDDFAGHSDKGSFSLGEDGFGNLKYIIKIVRGKSDNFFQIVNVLAHELIHAYDFESGKIEKIREKYSSEVLSGYVVLNANGKQYVSKDYYDSHGSFFKKWIDKFNSLGFDVQVKYNINGRRAMKKLPETQSLQISEKQFFADDHSNLTEKQIRLKLFFDSIDAPNKQFVYRDDGHWFISFP